MARGFFRHLEADRKPADRKIGGAFGEPAVTVADEEIKAYCGELLWASSTYNKAVTDESSVTCPKCRKKLANGRLKTANAGGLSLSMEADKTAKGSFRHAGGWKAFVGGDLVAYLGFQEHYWRVYPLRLGDPQEGGGAEVVNSRDPLHESGSIASLGSRSWHLESGTLRYPSKEEALLACVGLREQGFLKTGTELRAERDADLVRWRVENAARKKAKAEAQELLDETLAGLAELMERSDLSNFQRQAAANAIALLKKGRDD